MEYDKNKYKVINWKHWRMIHWVTNPGFVINELIIGQRMPKVLLAEKEPNDSESENKYVPCPHCGDIHDEKIWSQQNAFKNWFGYYCPTCGKTIPCIRNLTSLLLIILTAPAWIWFIKDLKNKWLENQPERFESIEYNTATEENAQWLKIGMSWGGLMYILATFINPLFTGEEVSTLLVFLGIPLWTIGGICFGYVISKWNHWPKTA